MQRILKQNKDRILHLLNLIFKSLWTGFWITPIVLFWMLLFSIWQGADIALIKNMSTKEFMSVAKFSLELSIAMAFLNHWTFMGIELNKKNNARNKSIKAGMIT